MGQISTSKVTLKNGLSVTIRTAATYDAAAILACSRATLTDSPEFNLLEPDELSFTVEQEAGWIRSHLEKPSHLCIVAENDRGEIVGLLNFNNGSRRRTSHAGSFGMNVSAAWRDLGLGSVLLEKFLGWARANNELERIGLCVHANNVRAIALYRKMGFREEGRIFKEIKYGPDHYADTVHMGLWLR